MDLSNLSSSTLYTNEELLVSYLAAQYPDLDLAIGTAIRDLVIRPAAVLYTGMQEDVGTVIDNLSITNCSNSDMLEKLLSNYNITRKAGAAGSGYISVFSTSSTDIIVPQYMTFTAGSNTIVLTDTYIGVPDIDALNLADTSNYREIKQYDDSTYYIIIPASTDGVMSGSVVKGQTLTLSDTVNNITGAVVASTFTGGAAAETDAEMKARVAEGITAKVPSGKAHIEALFKNLDTVNVYDLSVIGMGDEEMLRGRNNIYGVNPGGRVDIYAKTALYPVTIDTELDATCIDVAAKTWRMLIPKSEAPGFYAVSEIYLTGVNARLDYTGDIEYTFSVDTSDESYIPDIAEYNYGRYTKYQNASIEFTFDDLQTHTVGDIVEFNVVLTYMPGIDTLQDYISDYENRNPAGDYLIKAPVPVFMGAEAVILYPDYLDTPDENTVKKAISDAINATPMKRGFVSSGDIASAIKDLDSRYVVKMPIVLTSTIYAPDGDELHQRSVDTLEIEEDMEQAISRNTVAFYCSPENVSVSLIRANLYLG